MGNFQDVFNILFGVISVFSIISGFLIKEYQFIFWISGMALLIFVVFSFYVIDNRNKLVHLENKFKKIEESLNIYNRLNKLEIKMEKKAQINFLDIIKMGLAIIIIYVLVQSFKSF